MICPYKNNQYLYTTNNYSTPATKFDNNTSWVRVSRVPINSASSLGTSVGADTKPIPYHTHGFSSAAPTHAHTTPTYGRAHVYNAAGTNDHLWSYGTGVKDDASISTESASHTHTLVNTGTTATGTNWQLSLALHVWQRSDNFVDTDFDGTCPYEVGDVCIRYDNVNPANYYPGTTWSQYTTTALIVPVRSDNPYTAGRSYTGTTFGSDALTIASHTHTIGTSTMSHTHKMTDAIERDDIDWKGNSTTGYTAGYILGSQGGKGSNTYSDWTFSSSGGHTHTIGYTGVASSNQNRQRGRIYGIWRRTA